ncbi:MAG: 30S ribosome-binding factor RbfA [Bacilli bacterium]|nr:30S ribosome-binding factor RbfA [Bacilli bacterium]
MSIKIDRIGSALVREISYVLMTEIKNKDIRFVTITDCKVTSDLGYAKVYYTVLNQDRKEETEKALKSAAGFIRKQLFDRVDIRNIPELDFIYDESIEYGSKIEKIIEDIHEEEKED